MKITAIIPCVYTHFGKVHRVLNCYVKNARKPDQVLISLNGCQYLDSNFIGELERCYQHEFKEFKIIQNMNILSRGKARNVCIPYITGDIVCFSDADDEEHTQRFEIIEYFFTNYDIMHLLHSYILIKCHRNECNKCVLCQRKTYNNKFVTYDSMYNIDYCDPNELNNLNFPTESIITPNVKSIIGMNKGREQIMPVHGLVCVKKAVFDDIKFREDYLRGQDSLFSQEVLFKYKKSILVDAQLHIYDNGWIPTEKDFNKIGNQYINFGSPNPPKPGTPRTQTEINILSEKILNFIEPKKKILFSGFTREQIECVHGDYKFLRNCGPNAFISKYRNKPLGTFVTNDMHMGITKLKDSPFEKFRKHFCFEGGPLVGIKALLYNLSLRDDIHIEITHKFPILNNDNIDSFNYYYVHSMDNVIKQNILKNGSKLDNKLILSLHISQDDCNDLKSIKYIKWSHNSNTPAKFYLSYPIHKTLIEQYPLKKINIKRDKEILLYFKRVHKFKYLKEQFNQKQKLIIQYFNNKGYKTHIFNYTSGGYRRTELMDVANKCKLCLYLSFYDDGPLVINEITMMGCFIIGHKEIVNGHSNHSIPNSCMIKDINGIYMNDFAHIFKPQYDNNQYLEQCCNKIINLLEGGNRLKLDHLEIAKKTRDHFTEDRFLETVFHT